MAWDGRCRKNLFNPGKSLIMREEGKLIFMVDDDKVILNLLEYIFQNKNGYIVRTFPTGEECLDNMHLKPDLVVLDYILNEKNKEAMDGMETLKKLLEKDRNLPVIILSGHTDKKTGELMLNNGARQVLRKDDYFIDRLESYIISEIGQT
jgi:two-component system, OmpR family, response regulator